MAFHRGSRIRLAILAIILLALASPSYTATAATAIIAYKAQVPVTLDGVVSPGEWGDTASITEPVSGITVAFKQNGTGLLFLLEWQYGESPCSDQYCFGGIELGFLNNTGEMGTSQTPTLMILAGPSFKGGYDEFISTGDVTPTTVESLGYKTQSLCGTDFSGSNWVVECYRPFSLSDAAPYDPFSALAAGSPIEIAFAIGEFSQPGNHLATGMIVYTLALSNQTYTATSTTSTSSTSVTSSANASASSRSSTSSLLTSQTTSTSSKSSTSTSAVTSSPSPTTYSEELAVIVVGFSGLMLVALSKYRSR